jgi:hypothetical protein
MPLRFDKDGWLVPSSGVRVDTNVRTSKGYQQFSTPDGRPAGIVWHWTGGSANTSEANRDGLAPWLANYMVQEVVNPDRAASWNFYLDRNGRLWQHASIYMPTWTTTGSLCAYWNPETGKVEKSKASINRLLLGIEMENAGELIFKNGRWTRWPFGVDDWVNEDRAVLAPNGKYYDRWTDAQIRAAKELSIALKAALGWQDARHLHYSHEQFAKCGGGARGKIDPGSLWMDSVLPQIEAEIFGEKAGRTTGSTTPIIIASALGAAVIIIGAAYARRRRGL